MGLGPHCPLLKSRGLLKHLGLDPEVLGPDPEVLDLDPEVLDLDPEVLLPTLSISDVWAWTQRF